MLLYMLGEACPDAPSHINSLIVTYFLVLFVVSWSVVMLLRLRSVGNVVAPACLSIIVVVLCYHSFTGCLKKIINLTDFISWNGAKVSIANCGRRVLNVFYSQAYGVNYRRRRRRRRSRVNGVVVGGG